MTTVTNPTADDGRTHDDYDTIFTTEVGSSEFRIVVDNAFGSVAHCPAGGEWQLAEGVTLGTAFAALVESIASMLEREAAEYQRIAPSYPAAGVYSGAAQKVREQFGRHLT